MDQTITTKKTANGETKKRSGRAADDTPDANSPVELQNLLQSLRAMRSGDFTVRMGVEQDGILGKIADTFNDIVAANERMAQQLERVGQVVGREGKTRHRVKFGISNGAWDEMEVVGQYIDRRPALAHERSHDRHRCRRAGRSVADSPAGGRWPPAQGRIP